MTPAGPASSRGQSLPDDPNDPEGKILVNAFLLDGPLGPGEPNPAIPFDNPTPYGVDIETTWPDTAAVTHQTGETLSWLVVIQNSGRVS